MIRNDGVEYLEPKVMFGRYTSVAQYNSHEEQKSWMAFIR